MCLCEITQFKVRLSSELERNHRKQPFTHGVTGSGEAVGAIVKFSLFLAFDIAAAVANDPMLTVRYRF